VERAPGPLGEQVHLTYDPTVENIDRLEAVLAEEDYPGVRVPEHSRLLEADLTPGLPLFVA
jgi:hypothetical protein